MYKYLIMKGKQSSCPLHADILYHLQINPTRILDVPDSRHNAQLYLH